MNIPESREIFDEVLSRYSSMDKYLAPDADIIHSPIFDNVVVKVMKGREDELNNEEAIGLIDFLIPPVSNEDEQSNTNKKSGKHGQQHDDAGEHCDSRDCDTNATTA
jgi:hypothetical protein